MGLEEIRRLKENAGKPKEKKVYQIPKKSAKKIKQEAERKAAGSDDTLDIFFDEMAKRCKNKCLFCSGPTKVSFLRNDNEKWSQEANEKKWERDQEHMKRFAVSHLLPKRSVDKGGFPSVATNENNWIELCWQCHTSFDEGKITWVMLKDSKEWDIISKKLMILLPILTEEEKKHKLYDTIQKLLYAK